ncbi:MAG: hypothetical protein ABJN26_08775 [Stappiaceae bacterium]
MAGLLRWIAAVAILFLIGLAIPVIYIETSCRAKPVRSVFVSRILDEQFHGPEAGSYLSFPQWQIAYTYDQFAKTLEGSDENTFNYLRAVIDYWSSYCVTNQLAMRYGATDFSERAPSHLSGMSFTAAMAFKALYEETFGRMFANFRGQEKTLQDRFIADTATDYAAFLKNSAWSEYNFDQATKGLWAQPMEGPIRSWERRLAIGLEWQVKSVLASLNSALFSSSESDKSEIPRLSVVAGLAAEDLAEIEGLRVTQTGPEMSIIELPNNDAVTVTVLEILSKGGEFLEVEGNDDILLSFIRPNRKGGPLPFGYPAVWHGSRSGYGDERVLYSAKVSNLGPIIALFADEGLRLERIYNY